MPIPEDIKKKIQENLNKKLQEKGRNLVCPICGNNNFILADGFVNELTLIIFKYCIISVWGNFIYIQTAVQETILDKRRLALF